ncbi:LOW QUALITY PROTEIN: uncharacterized protein [Amphiura filiformis]|uniref:LOW QUALITY PROTEIN: uncharacterized protein n=1 Tax=Amphiura filiformis TaxID=82378 RepID=UPI003B2151E1
MSQSGGVNQPPVSGSGDVFNWHEQLQVPRVPLRLPQNSEENNKSEEKANPDAKFATSYSSPRTAYECLKCQMQFTSAAACMHHERSGCTQQASHLMAGFGNLGIPPLTHDGLAYTLGLPAPQNSDRKDIMDVLAPMAHASHMGPNSIPAPNSNMGNGMPETAAPKRNTKEKETQRWCSTTSYKLYRRGRSYSAGVVLTQASGDQGTLKYKCKICPQEYYTRSDVMLHARSHREGKPHKCNTCGKGFATTSDLQQHIRIHSNEKPYPCAYCEKGFKQLSHLQQHTRIHTGDRPYKCNYPDCDKSFTQLANLQQHWRRHNKDKPYKCRDCYRAHDELEKLQSHVSSHANTRREKRAKCGVCGKTHAQELYLMKHMAKHPQLSGIAPVQINSQPKLNNEAAASACTTCVHKKKHKHKHKHTTSLPSSSSIATISTQILANSLPTMVPANYHPQTNQDGGVPVSSAQSSREMDMTVSNSIMDQMKQEVQQKNSNMVSSSPNNANQSPHYLQASPMENHTITTSAAIASSPGMPPPHLSRGMQCYQLMRQCLLALHKPRGLTLLL